MTKNIRKSVVDFYTLGRDPELLDRFLYNLIFSKINPARCKIKSLKMSVRLKLKE